MPVRTQTWRAITRHVSSGRPAHYALSSLVIGSVIIFVLAVIAWNGAFHPSKSVPGEFSRLPRAEKFRHSFSQLWMTFCWPLPAAPPPPVLQPMRSETEAPELAQNAVNSSEADGVACTCAATSGNKPSCCSSRHAAGEGTGTFCGSLFFTRHCGGETPVCCTSAGVSHCCKQGSTCSSGCGGGGRGGKGFGGCGCVEPPPTTMACPHPVSVEYGTACKCTSSSCGSIPDLDPDILATGMAFIVTSEGVPGNISFMESEYQGLNPVDDSAGTPQMDIVLDPDVTYQTVLGFGGAFTDAVAHNYERLSRATRKQLMGQYFGAEGSGYTLGRVHIGGCDFSRMDYSLANVTGDYNMEHFCLRDDRSTDVQCGRDYKTTVIAAAQDAMDVANTGKLKLLASTWSAPPWMKDQHFSCETVHGVSECHPGADDSAVHCVWEIRNPETCVLNGQAEPCPAEAVPLRKDASLTASLRTRAAQPGLQTTSGFQAQPQPRPFDATLVSKSPMANANNNCYNAGYLNGDERTHRAWALYFLKFIEAYKAAGIDVWALTVQNEPLATTCLWPSMFYTVEMQAKFLIHHLGPLLRKAHPEVKILIHDDQTLTLLQFAGEILQNKEAARFVDGVAYHWYLSLEGTYENGPPQKPFPIGPGNLVGGGSFVADIWSMLRAQEGEQRGEQRGEKFLLMSEACNGYVLRTAWVGPRPGEWGYGYAYSHDVLWQLRNGVSGWMDWNLFLDMRGGPNLAGNFVDAAILVSDDDTFYQNPSFFHLAHFSKYIVPGSKRIKLDVTCGAHHPEFCQVVAFITPKGHVVVVMTNDEITVGPVAGAGKTNICLGDLCMPRLGEFAVPLLARGQGSLNFDSDKSLSWSIRCRTSRVSGRLPWKAIQTVVLPCV